MVAHSPPPVHTGIVTAKSACLKTEIQTDGSFYSVTISI